MGMTGYILFIFDALRNMRIMKEWGWMARSFIFHFWCIPGYGRRGRRQERYGLRG